MQEQKCIKTLYFCVFFKAANANVEESFKIDQSENS